ncbi:MAG TPA: phosphoribosylanthranilate isomerase [Usitatibacteraceae bacterium]
MHRTRVKICGMRSVDDALAAAAAGADAIGLIFYEQSPRVVSIDQALAIRSALPPFVSTVALFVNASRAQVASVLADVRPELLQFHGEEDEAYCASFQVRYLKAVRVGPGTGANDLLQSKTRFASASGLLLDALHASKYGGTGESFDWNLIPEAMRPQIVLSGGLTPQNVGGAVRAIRPWAVDVSSGVEAGNGATKGIKDHARIAAFINEVRRADQGS